MIFILLFCIFLYVIFIAWICYGMKKIKPFKVKSKEQKTSFSVVIPFRNETENLIILLNSISKLNYPKNLFEVILIDDASEDDVKEFNYNLEFQIIKNKIKSKAPKKDAITAALKLAKNTWIITTDADCVAPKYWLKTFDSYIQKHPFVEMIAGGIDYNCNKSFLHYFQHLDIESLQATTQGSFGIKKAFMCNGANFAYKKSFFTTLNGFSGNEKIASGDDVFLLQKAVKQFPKKVGYLLSKKIKITTKPMLTWQSLFQQRVRWASKTTTYKNTFAKTLAIIVFLGNLSWAIGLVFYLKKIWIALLVKCTIDTFLLYKSNPYLIKKSYLYFILSSFFYPFFCILVAFYSILGKYEWKGRQF